MFHHALLTLVAGSINMFIKYVTVLSIPNTKHYDI